MTSDATQYRSSRLRPGSKRSRQLGPVIPLKVVLRVVTLTITFYWMLIIMVVIIKVIILIRFMVVS